MNNSVLISVIMPIYNSERYLRQAIESVLGQTYENLELILVNDGSPDSSAQICKDYAERDSRVVFIDKENGGVSSARNAGLDAASGNYVGFVDADDVIHADMYEYLLKNAEKHGADITQCAAILVDKEHKSVLWQGKRNSLTAMPDGNKKSMPSQLSVTVWNKIYKKEILAGVRFDSRYPIGEDLRFNLEAILAARSVLTLREAKYEYIQRDNSACYRAPSEKSFTSYRRMATDAIADCSGYPKIKRYLKKELLVNNLDMLSRALRFNLPDADGCFREFGGESRANLLTVLFGNGIDLKSRCKLLALGIAPKLYRRSLEKKYRHGKA